MAAAITLPLGSTSRSSGIQVERAFFEDEGLLIHLERFALISERLQKLCTSHSYRQFRISGRGFALLFASCVLTVLAGCGGNVVLSPDSGVFLVTPTLAAFGNVTVGQSSQMTITLENKTLSSLVVSQVNISGSPFSITSQATLPATVASGGTLKFNVAFAPKAAGSASGQLSVSTTAADQSPAVVALSGTGIAPSGALSSLTCATSSLAGSAADACTVSLASAAGTGGLAVSLASSSAAVTVPASVTVASGATSATFQANVTAVSTAQTVTLTATASGASFTSSLQLAAVAGQLGVSASTVSFGDVQLNTPVTQTVTLSSTGTQALTIASATLVGTGFRVSGVNFPATLNPGGTATMSVQFDPATVGAATGSVTIASNSTVNPTSTVALSGTGVNESVLVTWDAPADSTDPVAGFHVYRAASGSSSYTDVGATTVGTTSYTDDAVQSGATYTYYVTSVDSSGVESVPSNTATVVLP